MVGRPRIAAIANKADILAVVFDGDGQEYQFSIEAWKQRAKPICYLWSNNGHVKWCRGAAEEKRIVNMAEGKLQI